MYENIIEVNNLTKKYENFLLDDISLAVPRGSIMGLIGENGAGKTTTIKLILNQIKRDSGQINIFGKDNIKDQYEIKEKVGVVFPENTFYEELYPSHINNIMSGIYRDWDKEKYDDYLKAFQLPQQKIKKFSTGMKMKLYIAIAMAHTPDLLLLDEATSGLDPVVRNEVLDMLQTFIQEERKGILFSSHITTDLERIADYITYIHEGKIIFSEEKDIVMEKYGILKGPKGKQVPVDEGLIISKREREYSDEYLISDKRSLVLPEEFVLDGANLDDIMTFHKKENKVELI